MKPSELETPEHQEGFNARLRGIESIIEKAMQKHNNSLTLNFFLSPIGQHIERTNEARVLMRKDDKMECQNIGGVNVNQPSLTFEEVVSVLPEALRKCKEYIWGNAAYSVPFCVCRDIYSMDESATSFELLLREKGIKIPSGTINSAFYRNSWLKYHIDKWKEMGASKRALKFKEAFLTQVENIVLRAKKQGEINGKP